MTIIVRELSPITTVKDTSFKRLKKKCVVFHNKPRPTRLALGFQDNLTSLNNSQALSQNIPSFRSSQTLLILVVYKIGIMRATISYLNLLLFFFSFIELVLVYAVFDKTVYKAF